MFLTTTLTCMLTQILAHSCYIDDELISDQHQIDFGHPAAHPYLRKGWFDDEYWNGNPDLMFCWSSAQRSEFYLGVDELTDYHLFVRCRPFTYPDNPPQEIRQHMRTDGSSLLSKFPGYVFRHHSNLLRFPWLNFVLIGPFGLVGMVLALTRWKRLFLLYSFVIVQVLTTLLFFTLASYYEINQETPMPLSMRYWDLFYTW